MRLLQIELWTDFESAGGSRLLFIPPSQVFSAQRKRTLVGQDDLSLTIDGRLTALFGGGFSILVPATFTQNVDGRVVQENFTRADSNTIGAPSLFPPAAAVWTEVGESGAGDLRILTNEFDQAVDTPSTLVLRRTDLAMPTEFIIQATLRARVTNAFPRIFTYHNNAFPAPGSDLYDAGLDRAGGNFELRVLTGGVIEDSDIVAVPGGVAIGGPAPSGNNYGIRMVGRTSGADFVITGWMNSPLGSTLALSSASGYAVAQIATATDTSPVLAVGSYGYDCSRRSFSGRIDASGVDFTMTGLPTGATIEIDGSTPVAEAGGTAVLPMDGVPMPGTLCTVKNASSQIIGTLSPALGLFGADSYSLDTQAIPSTFQRGGERRVIRVVFENPESPGFQGQVQEWRIN